MANQHNGFTDFTGNACPLLSIGRAQPVDCLEHGCQWYFASSCALVELACSVSDMSAQE